MSLHALAKGTIELESSASRRTWPALPAGGRELPFFSLSGSGQVGLVNGLCALLAATLSAQLASRYEKCRHKNSPLKNRNKNQRPFCRDVK